MTDRDAFEEAARRVAADVRRALPGLSEVEAVVRAYVEPSPPSPDVAASTADHVASLEAWRVVTRTLARGPSREDLERLVERLTRSELVTLTALEECWIALIQRSYRT